MKSKFTWLILSCLIVLSLILASCGTKTAPTTTPTTVATIKPTTTLTTTPTTIPTTAPPNSGGKWWDKFGEPQYGGISTYRANTDPTAFDPFFGTGGAVAVNLYMDQLAMGDWALDRKIFDFTTNWKSPEYMVGRLAERWEVSPDWKTYIFYIRKGIKWQDKPPVNGRELTAYDIEYTWHRLLGLGSGFTKPTPYYGTSTFSLVSSVTATNKYTLVFKLSAPSSETLNRILDDVTVVFSVVPREAVEKFGDLQNWKNAIASGPFILDDYVSGSSLSFSNNPNYWMFDERYPKNKLPYVDEIKVLIIPDDATAFAALRTGKIDAVGQYNEPISWQQGNSLKKTNPELVMYSKPANGKGLSMRVDNTPFTDIRVRKAMQMAINLDDIAKSFYGGFVDSTPYGDVGPMCKGYYTPYSEWPQEVKDGFKYNPDGAKKLLAQAGYPNGFKTNVVTPSNEDLDLLQILKSYFIQIGVDMEIRVMDPASYTAFVRAAKHDAMAPTRTAAATPPLIAIQGRQGGYMVVNYGQVNDPVYDGIVAKAFASLDIIEQKKLVKQADDYDIAHFWVARVLPIVNFALLQPWLKGYSGENLQTGIIYSRCWIDMSSKRTYEK